MSLISRKRKSEEKQDQLTLKSAKLEREILFKSFCVDLLTNSAEEKKTNKLLMNIAEKDGSSFPHMSAIFEEEETNRNNATSAYIADLIGNVTDIDLRQQLRKLEASEFTDCQQQYGEKSLSDYSSCSSRQVFDPNEESGIENDAFSQRRPQSKYFEKFLQGEDLTDTSTQSAIRGNTIDQSLSNRRQANRNIKLNQKIHDFSVQEPRDNDRLMDEYMKLRKQIEDLALQVQDKNKKSTTNRDQELNENGSVISQNESKQNMKRKKTNSLMNKEILLSKQIQEELQSSHTKEVQQLRMQMLVLVEEKSGLEVKFKESQSKLSQLSEEYKKYQEETRESEEKRAENTKILREQQDKIDEKTKQLDERTKLLEEKMNQVKEREIRVQKREDRVRDKEDRIQEREDKMRERENKLIQEEKEQIKDELSKAKITQHKEKQEQLNNYQKQQNQEQLSNMRLDAQQSITQRSEEASYLNKSKNEFLNRTGQYHLTTPNISNNRQLANSSTQSQLQSYQQSETKSLLQQQQQLVSPPVRLRSSFHSERPQKCDQSDMLKELSVNSEAAANKNHNQSEKLPSEQSYRDSIASEQLPNYNNNHNHNQHPPHKLYQTESNFYPLGSQNSKKGSSSSASLSSKLNIDKINSEIQMLKNSLMSTDLLLRQSKKLNLDERVNAAGTATTTTGKSKAYTQPKYPEGNNHHNNFTKSATGEDRFLSETSKDSDIQGQNQKGYQQQQQKPIQYSKTHGETPGLFQNNTRQGQTRVEPDNTQFQYDSQDESQKQNNHPTVFPISQDLQKPISSSQQSLQPSPLISEPKLLPRTTHREGSQDGYSKRTKEDQIRREVSARPRLSEHSASEIHIKSLQNVQSRSNSINQSTNSSNAINLDRSLINFGNTNSANYFPMQQHNRTILGYPQQSNQKINNHKIINNQGQFENVLTGNQQYLNQHKNNNENILSKLNYNQNGMIQQNTQPLQPQQLLQQGLTNFNLQADNYIGYQNPSHNVSQDPFLSQNIPGSSSSNNSSKYNWNDHQSSKGHNIGVIPKQVTEVEEEDEKININRSSSSSSLITLLKSNSKNSNKPSSQISVNNYQPIKIPPPFLLSASISKREQQAQVKDNHNVQIHSEFKNIQITPPTFNPLDFQKQQQIQQLQQHGFIPQLQQQTYYQSSKMNPTFNMLPTQSTPDRENQYFSLLPMKSTEHQSWQEKQQQQFNSLTQSNQGRLLSSSINKSIQSSSQKGENLKRLNQQLAELELQKNLIETQIVGKGNYMNGQQSYQGNTGRNQSELLELNQQLESLDKRILEVRALMMNQAN